MLYGRQEVRAEHQPEHLYSLCGVDGDRKTLPLLTLYDETDEEGERTVTLDFGRQSTYEVFLLDQTHDGTLLGKVDGLTFTLPVHTSLLIREL